MMAMCSVKGHIDHPFVLAAHIILTIRFISWKKTNQKEI